MSATTSSGVITQLVLCLFLALPFMGCATQAAAPAPVPPPAAAPSAQPSAQPELKDSPNNKTYGTITSRVEKGKTTQGEIVELFGGPNIATTDRDGVETWVYEVKSSTTKVENKEHVDVKGQAIYLFLFGAAAGTGDSTGETKTTYSMKNLTFIIKFNKDKTVKDYEVRQVSI